MKVSECIGILLLTVASHQVLAHGVGRCGNNKYLHGGICCNLCPAGTHLVGDCTLSTDTICTPCDDGHTYTAYPNRLQGCLRCKHCDGHVGLVVKPGGACVPTKNTECQCREGMYHPHESSQVCVNHSTCPQGEEPARKGTPVSDTVCRPCPDGTFSNRESLTKCRTWRNCTAMGMKTVRNGTSIRNARCEPFPTTSTSSQTVAPVLRVNSTSNSASTATTATYRSAYTTAAPTTSTMHSSTSAAKPPVQQTTDESESPATMSVTPPTSDTNPEVDGGNGPNHHDNKAQVATAVVVGLIAFVLIVCLLLGIAYYFRKWQQRRRWQRRPDYRSFPLPEDEDLQAGDLERRQQVPKDNVGRAGHVRRTTATGATPRDNTSPHEIESLIQSGGGTLPHDTDTIGAEGLPAIHITDVHLVKLAKEMPKDWKTIGIEYFNITAQDLDRLETKHPFERDMQIFEMFKLWTGREGKAAKLHNLCQKLNEAGVERRVLCELFSKEETQTKSLVD